MKQDNDAVVASLQEKSNNPYVSLTMAPDQRHLLLAEKDAVQLVRADATGITSLRRIKITPHFFAASTSSGDRRSNTAREHGDVRDTFKIAIKQSGHSHASNAMVHSNVVVTAVAWSPSLHQHNSGNMNHSGKSTESSDPLANTLFAASGSNGMVIIWKAKQTLFSSGGKGESAALASQQPEAILSQHTRSVSSLAWHPRRQGMLLTASHDGSVKLWERREVARKDTEKPVGLRFDFFKFAPTESSKEYHWKCRNTFVPKETILEVKWSRFQDEVFGAVTRSGSLIVYNIHVNMKALVKIAAHTGDATSLDWHPTRNYVVATGGSGDRCVKVWDLENNLNLDKKVNVSNINVNTSMSTWNTQKSELSVTSASSSDTDTLSSTHINAMNSASINSTRSLSNLSGRHKSSAVSPIHVLSISSSVNKVRWRPPSADLVSAVDEGKVDRHDSNLAVATAPLTNAGGFGVVGLWSFHRPFMPLSVVQGHTEGAIADFAWLKTPSLMDGNSVGSIESTPKQSREANGRQHPKKNHARPGDDTVLVRSSGWRDTDFLFDNNSPEKGQATKAISQQFTGHIWQHVLSIGRDGRCIMQSLARGHRPISKVPSSCFALANLSPFQPGYGSLQVLSVYQNVPNEEKQDFDLTGLRQDEFTESAPGIFKEESLVNDSTNLVDSRQITGKRLPESFPDIVFNVVDQGVLNTNGAPLSNDESGVSTVAPEVIHLSRFASLYVLYLNDSEYSTRVELCLHNGQVAEDLHCTPLAHMWRTLAEMLRASGLEELPSLSTLSSPMNVMQFTMLPTIHSLLVERADAGDVQTCVAVCEVLQVIEAGDGPETSTTRIPGLELNLVREWYLSYIELLHQMCLFSSATYLIRNCKDSFIGALNQKSTTIHEACPRCGKALDHPSTDGAMTTSDDGTTQDYSRRVCKNCRRRVGLCFLCHQPVKGLFVWCPGCGHGGHLNCALLWFGGDSTGGSSSHTNDASSSGESSHSMREVCPTGCGHRCNFVRVPTAFPRTDSMQCLPVTSGGAAGLTMELAASSSAVSSNTATTTAASLRGLSLGRE